jgi:hypothetical protein
MKTRCCTLFVLLTACGGSIVDDGTDSTDAGSARDARRDAPTTTTRDASRAADADADPHVDSYVAFREDACPEVLLEPPDLECDPFSQPSQCGPDQGCYPIPPRATDSCHPGRYATRCLSAGRGGQGVPCGGGTDCADGFICVKSSTGDQCVQLCHTNVYGACGEGRVCIEVDVTGSGWGGCQ